jgi:4-amino-4-deoxy-L-arabinose transferase-like glycosyltransferase
MRERISAVTETVAKYNRTEYELIINLLLVSGLFRFAYLGQESITVDSDRTLYISMLHPVDFLSQYPAIQPSHPPLYYIFVQVSQMLFGVNYFAVRLPTVIAGILTVAFVYLIGRRLYTRRVGTIASLLTAVSAYHLHWSQTAKGYALMGLFVVTSYYFLIEVLFGENRLRSQIGYAVSVAALFYTHYLGIFFIFTQLVTLGAVWALSVHDRDRDDITIWAGMFAGAGLLVLPWLPMFIRQATDLANPNRGSCCVHATTPGLLDTIKPLASFIGLGNFVDQTLMIIVLTPLVVGVSLLALRLLHTGRETDLAGQSGLRARIDEQHLVVPLWVGLPLATLWTLPLVTGVTYYAGRFLLPSALGFYLLFAVGVEQIDTDLLRQVALVVLIVSFAMTGVNHVVMEKKPDWQDGTAYVERNMETGDAVLVGNPMPYDEFEHYSTRRDYLHVKSSFNPTAGEIHEKVDNRSRVWVIGWSGKADKSAQLLQDGDVYSLQQQRSFPNKTEQLPTAKPLGYVTVYLFEKNNEPHRPREVFDVSVGTVSSPRLNPQTSPI